jgi:uncharacterized membrane protein YqgA involved in biofilm formation
VKDDIPAFFYIVAGGVVGALLTIANNLRLIAKAIEALAGK